MRRATWDVLVLGEVLVELSLNGPLRAGERPVLGFSGDALNQAAAAAAAGARTALLALVPTDELGDALCQRVAEFGISTELMRRVPGQHGVYFVGADPTGLREFVYVRGGSTGSMLAPEHVADVAVEEAQVVVASGVTAALSSSAREAVLEAARRSRRFVYDPNHRPRLATAKQAAATLAAVAPLAEVVTPSAPADSEALLGTADAAEAARRCLALGARTAVITRGEDGALVAEGHELTEVLPVAPPRVVDQTGAGDVLTGTVAARLALGDPLREAVRLGAAAASLSVQGHGGTGHVPPLEAARAHLRAAEPGA